MQFHVAGDSMLFTAESVDEAVCLRTFYQKLDERFGDCTRVYFADPHTPQTGDKVLAYCTRPEGPSGQDAVELLASLPEESPMPFG